MGKNWACIKFTLQNLEVSILEQYIFIPDKNVNNDIKSVKEWIVMAKKLPNLFSKDCELGLMTIEIEPYHIDVANNEGVVYELFPIMYSDIWQYCL